MNTECSSIDFQKISPPINLLNECCSGPEASIQVPRDEFIKLLKVSERIQDLTNQINLLAINAALEAVCTGQDDFAVAVNEICKLIRESGIQGEIIGNTLKSLSEEFDFQM